MSLFATTSKDHYQQSIYLIQFCKQYWTSPTFWPSSVGTLLTQLSPAITPPPLSGLFYFQSPRLFSSVSSVANCRLPFFKHFLWSTGDTLFLLFSSFRKRKTYRTFWRHHSGALISSKKKVPLNALFLFFLPITCTAAALHFCPSTCATTFWVLLTLDHLQMIRRYNLSLLLVFNCYN